MKPGLNPRILIFEIELLITMLGCVTFLMEKKGGTILVLFPWNFNILVQNYCSLKVLLFCSKVLAYQFF